MSESPIWSVDRLAANALLLALGMEPDNDLLEMVAGHFALHRFNSYEWIAQKVHSSVVGRLEEAVMEDGRSHRGTWMDGYQRAEKEVLTMTLDEMVGIENREGRTTGQVLRAMVRQAKHQYVPISVPLPVRNPDAPSP